MNVDWNRFELVLESLGVLARLTENKKLTIRTGHIDIEKYNLIQSLIRGWKGDMRTNCLESVKHIVNEAIHMARASLQEVMHPPLMGAHYRHAPPSLSPISNSVNPYGSSTMSNTRGPNGPAGVDDQLYLEQQRSMRRFGRLTEALEAASSGIETQNVTYKNDEHFCAKVKVLVDSIHEALEDMQISLATAQKPPPSGAPNGASHSGGPHSGASGSTAPPAHSVAAVSQAPLVEQRSSVQQQASSPYDEDELDMFG